MVNSTELKEQVAKQQQELHPPGPPPDAAWVYGGAFGLLLLLSLRAMSIVELAG